MPRITMTYDLAMAAAKDKANGQMRKAGRTAWNEDDYNLSAEEFNRLFPMEQYLEWIKQGKPR